jgi:hypothetical protein
MFNLNDLITGDTQLTISREVLTLLRWLMEHHAEELSKLTKRALQTGLHDKLCTHHSDPLPHPEEAYDTITQFFGTIEETLLYALDEHVAYKTHENKLQPTLNHIDSTVCDANTVQLSVEHASTKMAKQPGSNPRDMLFQEILLQWRPHKSNVLN